MKQSKQRDRQGRIFKLLSMYIQAIIMFQQKNDLPKEWSPPFTHLDGVRKPINLLFKEIPAINLKKALLDDPSRDDVLGEIKKQKK
jgi:hypothetical protein